MLEIKPVSIGGGRREERTVLFGTCCSKVARTWEQESKTVVPNVKQNLFHLVIQV